MSNMAQPNYSEALKEIKKAVQSLSKEVSEIKALLFRIHEIKEQAEIEEKLCPTCKNTLVLTEGCHICIECGYSGCTSG